MTLDRVPPWLWLLGLLFFVGYETRTALDRPDFKWDYQAYVLASYEQRGKPIGKGELELARNDIEGFVKEHAAQVRKGKESSAYGRRFLSDPQMAQEILSFYRPRVLFVRAVRLLSIQLPGKLDRSRAAHLLGAVFVGLGALVFSRLQRVWDVPWPLVLLASFATFYGFNVADVARLGQPDGAAFFVSALMLLAFARGHLRTLLFLSMAVPLVRQDLTVFALLLLGAGVFARRVRPVHAALSGAVAIAGHVALNIAAKSPPWGVLIYHTFIARVRLPLSAPKSIEASQYFAILARLGHRFFHDGPWLLWLVTLALLGVAGIWSYERVRYDRRLLLTAVCVVYAVIHIALFPMLWNRFFVAQYVLTLSALISLLVEQRARFLPEIRTAIQRMVGESKRESEISRQNP